MDPMTLFSSDTARTSVDIKHCDIIYHIYFIYGRLNVCRSPTPCDISTRSSHGPGTVHLHHLYGLSCYGTCDFMIYNDAAITLLLMNFIDEESRTVLSNGFFEGVQASKQGLQTQGNADMSHRHQGKYYISRSLLSQPCPDA